VTAVLPDSKASINEISTTNKSSIILIINKRVVRHKKIEDVNQAQYIRLKAVLDLIR
jgi:hypothetical protein